MHMSASLQTKNQHLLWRAGFGPAAGQWEDMRERSLKRTLKSLETDSKAQFVPFKITAGSAEA